MAQVLRGSVRTYDAWEGVTSLYRDFKLELIGYPRVNMLLVGHFSLKEDWAV